MSFRASPSAKAIVSGSTSRAISTFLPTANSPSAERTPAMTRTIRSFALSGLLVALVSTAVHAQFVVYDPTNYLQALTRYAQLLQQYQFWVNQARRLPVDMASRYRLSPLRWQSHDIAGSYTYAQPILSALNQGDVSGTGYDADVDRLTTLDDLLTSVPVDLRPRLRTIYGSIQLDDSAAKMAINQ